MMNAAMNIHELRLQNTTGMGHPRGISVHHRRNRIPNTHGVMISTRTVVGLGDGRKSHARCICAFVVSVRAHQIRLRSYVMLHLNALPHDSDYDRVCYPKCRNVNCMYIIDCNCITPLLFSFQPSSYIPTDCFILGLPDS